MLDEYALAIGLWVPSWHRFVIPLGVLIHAVTYVTLPVYTFSVTMVAAYLVVLDPAAVHRFVDTLVGGPERPSRTLPPEGAARSLRPP